MKEKNKTKKEDKIVSMVYDDMIEFLTSKKSWKGKNGNFVAYGLLNAVFQMIFSLAPSKKAGMQIVMMSLSNFMEEKQNKEEKK